MKYDFYIFECKDCRGVAVIAEGSPFLQSVPKPHRHVATLKARTLEDAYRAFLQSSHEDIALKVCSKDHAQKVAAVCP